MYDFLTVWTLIVLTLMLFFNLYIAQRLMKQADEGRGMSLRAKRMINIGVACIGFGWVMMFLKLTIGW